MNVTLCSAFRSAEPYIPRYLAQCAETGAALSAQGHALSFIWAEGDSADRTGYLLREAARYRFLARVVSASHGGPNYGSIENEQRFQQLSYVANKVWAWLPLDADAIIWAESDLIWTGATMARLVEHLEVCSAVAPMIYDGPSSFYDVFAFRCHGQRFTKTPPYHPEVAAAQGGLLEVDSVGSIIAMRGDVARGVYVPAEDVLVGTCRMIRENGGSVWVDTGLSCQHP